MISGALHPVGPKAELGGRANSEKATLAEGPRLSATKLSANGTANRRIRGWILTETQLVLSLTENLDGRSHEIQSLVSLNKF